MKELKINPEIPILETHYPIYQRYQKRWIAAQTKGPFKQKLEHNNNVEAAYHRVISLVKSAIAGKSTLYYEKDLKHDKELGLYGMHSFFTDNFYWWLECDLCCDYRIRFGFEYCPYESDIRKLMRAYPLDRVTTEKVFQTDLRTFQQNVLRCEGAMHFFTS
jgi:hypothetical protein